MADKLIIITQEEREKLQAEYRNLVDVQMPDAVEKLALARSQGDLKENADYDAARDRTAQIESRIQEIENILNNAISPEQAGINEGKGIHIGDTVTFLKGEQVRKVKVVGSTGGDASNPGCPTVSNESPIGKALLGHDRGETVRIEAPVPYEVTIQDFSK